MWPLLSGSGAVSWGAWYRVEFPCSSHGIFAAEIFLHIISWALGASPIFVFIFSISLHVASINPYAASLKLVIQVDCLLILL